MKTKTLFSKNIMMLIITWLVLAPVITSVGWAQSNKSAFVSKAIKTPSGYTITRETPSLMGISPVITWENPADIAYGTPLGIEQLNASTDVEGTFVYTPDIGTYLPAGANQLLSVMFIPNDIEIYDTAYAQAYINVIGLDRITGVTVDPVTAQYSDMVMLTATIYGGAPVAPEGPQAAMSVTFTIGGQVMKDEFENAEIPLVINGEDLVATLYVPLTETSLMGSMMPETGKIITATFNNPDANFMLYDNPALSSLNVTQENARACFTAPTLISIPPSGMTTIPLRATIQDITAVESDPATDEYAGDIRNARVRFWYNSMPIVVEGITDMDGWLTPALINPADWKTGIVTLNWPVNFSIEEQTEYMISIEIGHYYMSDGYLDAFITLYPSTEDFVTGGGYIMPTQSAGQYAGDAGQKANFGFNAKYNKQGTSLHGNINYIFRRTVDDALKSYQIKSKSMIFIGTNVYDPMAKTAVLLANASLRDVTDTLEPIMIADNLVLQINLTDRGEPGHFDSFALSLWDEDALLYASNWAECSNNELELSGGNLVVHGGYSMMPEDENIQKSGKEAGITEYSDDIMVSVYPNPYSGPIQMRVSINTSDKVAVDIYSVTGVHVERILDEYMESGKEKLITLNNNLPEGMYFYRIQAGNHSKAGKIIITR